LLCKTIHTFIQPLIHYISSQLNIRNVLTYDGYLTTSLPVREWIEDISFGARKTAPIAFYANTVGETKFPEIDYSNPSLAYFGSSTEDDKHGRLFQILSQKPYFQIYGSVEKWTHVDPSAVKGQVLSNGNSVLEAYREAGVGLCINKKEIRGGQQATNHIFEIVASGAIAICGREPWIEEHFGDSVLYVDMANDLACLLQEIDTHMAWVSAHPNQAKKIAQKAHEIFVEKFTMEKMLETLFGFHEEVLKTQGFVAGKNRTDEPEVSFIVRTGNRPGWMLDECVNSLAQQTYGKITVLLVQHSPQEGINELEKKYQNLNVQIIDAPGAKASKALWTGLKNVKTEWFCILDDDDKVYPNHLFTLFRTIRRHNKAKNWYGDVMVAYSGSVERKQKGFFEDEFPVNETSKPRLSPAQIKLFDFFQTQKLLKSDFLLAPCCILVKSELLDEDVLTEPRADHCEDLYLFHLLSEKTNFAFSGQLSAQINLHEYGQSGYQNSEEIYVLSRMRITFRTWGTSYQLTGKLTEFRSKL